MRVIAMLLVVQGALLAFSQGASADTLRRDQFGNVLCLASASAEHRGNHGTSDSHADMLACCSLGCSMFVATGAPQPVTSVPIDIFVELRSRSLPSYADMLPSVPKSPRTTRGPPEAV